jgi:microcystin-dependent protein
MAFTPTLKLSQPVTGTQSGTWGDTVNNAITQPLEDAVTGWAIVTVADANPIGATLTSGDGAAANQSRKMFLEFEGLLSANRNVIYPFAANSKLFYVYNKTTSATSTLYSIVLKTTSGTGVTIPNGARMAVYCDDVGDFYEANSFQADLEVTDLVATSLTVGDSSTHYAVAGLNPNLQIYNTTQSASSLALLHWNAASLTSDGSLIFGRVNSATVGSFTAVTDGQFLGNITYAGGDGSAISGAITITGVARGTWTTSSQPADLVFETNPSGTATAREVFRFTYDNKYQFNSETAGVVPTITTAGTDTNINLNVVPKGTGQLQYKGVEVATTAVAVPTGTIQMWSTNTAPTGYLLCDGAAVSRTTYATLFALIASTYGAGNGTTTFNVPNLENRVPIGAGDLYALASTGGSRDAVIPTNTISTASLTGNFIFGANCAVAMTASGIVEEVATSGDANQPGFGSGLNSRQYDIDASHTHSIVGAAQTFTAATTDIITMGTGWDNNISVKVSTTGTLPGGLSSATTYFIVQADVTAETCKLSTSVGGSPVDISSTGTGTHTMTIQEQSGVQRNLQPYITLQYIIKT